jgi:hypothetical protein
MAFDDISHQALLAQIRDLEVEKYSLQMLVAELLLKNQRLRDALAGSGSGKALY